MMTGRNRALRNLRGALHPNMKPADQEIKFCEEEFASEDDIEMTLNISYAGRDRDLNR